MVCFGYGWFVFVRFGLFCFGSVCFALASFDLIGLLCFGFVWFALFWLDLVLV
jgi:hypothetical protein